MEVPKDLPIEEPQLSLFYGEDYEIEGYDDIYPLDEVDLTFLAEIDENIRQNQMVSKHNLRRNWWYQDILKNLSFQIKDIRPDRAFGDILLDYQQHLQEANNPRMAHPILRYELRQVVRSQNKALARQVELYLPHRYNYQHVRRCPNQDPRYLALDQDPQKVLNYEVTPAIAILNSVGLQAVMGNVDKLQKRLREYRKEVGMSKLSLYDVVPTSFLLGRLWSVRSLNAYLEDTFRHDLTATVETFESHNRLVAAGLRRPQEGQGATFYPKISYYTINQRWTNIYEDEATIRHYGIRFDN